MSFMGVQLSTSGVPERSGVFHGEEPIRMPATAPLRLAAQGLGRDDLSVLDAILRVVGERTARRWTRVDGDDGDLLLTTRDAQPAGAAGLTALLLREDEAAAEPDQLSLQAPLRVMAVLDLLNAAHDRLRRAESNAAQVATVQPISREQDRIECDDGRSLAAALARLVGRRPDLTLRIRIVGYGTLYLCLKSRIHHADFPADRLADALGEHRFVMTMIPAGSAELVVRMDSARPADEVLWQIGMTSTSETPHTADAAFRLVRWPDFARLPHRADDLRLCAAMSRAHQRVDALMALGGSRRGDVDHLLHACALCGLLDVDTRAATTAPVPAPTGGTALGGLFDRLRRRFGL